MKTLSSTDFSTVAVLYHVLSALRFRARRTGETTALILDSDGASFGHATRMSSGQWAVHTVPFAGTVDEASLDFVDPLAVMSVNPNITEKSPPVC